MSALDDITAAGVSVWLDDLGRDRLASGSLAELVRGSCVRGVTTNPAIFRAAVSAGTAAYRDDLVRLAAAGLDADAALRIVTTDDVRAACDLLLPTWEATDGIDGRVSIEVDPRLAHDTEGTVAQARDLHALVDRPNVLVKIPATPAGLPAIARTLAEGISVNVTLIFSVDRYREVMGAFLDGLEAAAARGRDLRGVVSVASLFVSRLDTEVDRQLDRLVADGGDPGIAALRGTAAIANARLAWFAYLGMLAGSRWAALAAQGARPQRPLWASTGVKDPAYDATRYVLELVAPGCVNTMPEPTLDAVRDRGRFTGDTVSGRDVEAREQLAALAAAGIDLPGIFALLEEQGVRSFVDSWEQLRATVADAMGLDPAGG